MESGITSVSTSSVETGTIIAFQDDFSRLVQQAALLTRRSKTWQSVPNPFPANWIPSSFWYYLQNSADVTSEIECALAILYQKQVAMPLFVGWMPGSSWCYFQSTTGVTSEIENMLAVLHQKQVAIPHSAEIRDYLLHCPDMIGRLPVVCGIARLYLEHRSSTREVS